MKKYYWYPKPRPAPPKPKDPMPTYYRKTASSYGRLWGWPNAEDEKAYVQRRAKDFQATDAPGAVVAYSQLIEYPGEGLQCIQTETWVRMKK